MKPEATEAKKLGNDCLKEKKYFDAMFHYTKAIKLEPEDASLYSNRSLAFLKITQHHFALQDAQKTISLKPKWVKGYFRKGEVEFAAEHYAEAVISYKAGLALERDNEDLRKAAVTAQTQLDKQIKADNRLPMYSTSIGLFFGLVVAVLQDAGTATFVVVVIMGIVLGYLAGLAYRRVVQGQRSSLLDPPIDLFPEDEAAMGTSNKAEKAKTS